MNQIQFILGGARSGKSALAEIRATELGIDVCYVATAQALDDEMASRIVHHKNSRPSEWQVIEEPLNLANVLTSLVTEAEKKANQDKVILIDCLTLWLNNWLCQNRLESWREQRSAFLDELSRAAELKVPVIIVSNEVGHGIVPLGDLTRSFVDEAGWLHQEVAKIAGRVDFVMAGLAMPMKPLPMKTQPIERHESTNHNYDSVKKGVNS